MSVVSTSILYHFTNSMDNLVNILHTCFLPNLSKEECLLFDNCNFWEIPMVCFCDIPQHLVKPHSDRYGKYAIGLSKEWGVNKGISPVHYIHKNSLIVKDTWSKLLTDDEFLELNYKYPEQFYFYCDLLYSAFFMKPCEGYDRKSHSNRHFYDEREWRYIPPKSELIRIYNNQFSVTPDYFFLTERNNSNENRAKVVKMCYRNKIHFLPSDIKTIIVPTEEHKGKCIEAIHNEKRGFSPITQELLISNIDTMERIEQNA